MALSASTVLEVRTGGADTNGGGFVTGASGTDWSQQNAAQYSVADGIAAGTTTLTSATANFGTDVVGNLIYVQGGTGSITAGWYQITARTNSTTITVDRSTGLTAGTGVTLKIGGALLTPATANSITAVVGQIVYVTGTYTLTANLVISGVHGVLWIGYTSSRTDNGQATFTGSGSVTTIVSVTNYGNVLRNITVDCAGITGTTGFTTSGTECGLQNCKVTNYKTAGMNVTSTTVFGCEVSGGTGTAITGSGMAIGCDVHGNAGVGINGLRVVTGCRVYSNTGATSDGIVYPGSSSGAFGLIQGNSVYGNGRHAINATGAYYPTMNITNNICVGNGGFGLNIASRTDGALPGSDYNAYYNNTSGAYGVAAVAGPHDVTLSGDPFVASGSGNFALNSTAGAGAACRAVAFIGTSPSGTTTGYLDVGAAQHQDSGVGGGLAANPMAGFIH